MTNSPIEISDALNVLSKLIARTKEGRLAWDADGGYYKTTLGPNLRATVSQSSTFDFTLVEFDPRFESEIDALVAGESRIPDKTVLDISIETNPAYGYDTIEEKRLAESLRDMLVLARRSALDVNSSMQRALTYLDRIAG